MQTFNGAIHAFELPEGIRSEVEEFCQAQNVTPYMVLLGAYQLLMSRYSGQDDICVGTPIAGRSHVETENLIGFFVNGLPMRTKLDGNPSVKEYLARVKETALGAFSHQSIPIERILDEIPLERDPAYPPLVQVAFALQNVMQDSAVSDMVPSMHGLSIEPLSAEHVSARYDMTLNIYTVDEAYRGQLEYNRDLFDASTVERMMSHYVCLLGALISKADRPLDSIEMVSQSELLAVLDLDSSAVQKILPLTHTQRDLYLDTLIHPDTLQNNIGVVMSYSAELDVALWRRVFELHVAVNSVMRTRIVSCDLPYVDVAYQVVMRQSEVDFEYLDLREQSLTEEALQALIDSKVYRAYDFNEDKLVGMSVLQLAEEKFRIVFRANHTVIDGVAIFAWAHSSCVGYEALIAGERWQAEPDKFAEYIEYERSAFDSYSTRIFWRDALSSVEALDYHCTNTQEQRTGSLQVRSCSLAGDAYAGLKNYCRAHRTTPVLYLQSLYALLVQSYCRADADFALTEVQGGRIKGHEQTLGNYYRTMPWVYEQRLFAADATIDSLLSYSSTYRKSVKEYQSISAMAQNECMPAGRLGFVFNYYNFVDNPQLLGQEAILSTCSPRMRDQIQLIVKGGTDKLELELHYYDGVFAETNIRQLMNLAFAQRQLRCTLLLQQQR